MLLEGTNWVEAALAQDKTIHHACFTSNWHTRYPQLSHSLANRAEHCRQVSGEALRKIASTVNPDGVIITLASRTCWLSPPVSPKLGLVLERLQDPGNLGTIIRTAAATGVDGIWYSADCADPESPKVLRASAGCSLLVPQKKETNLSQQLAQWQQQQVQIVATSPTTPQTYWQLDYCQPTVFLVGSEGQGLSQSLLDSATHQVRIPQSPQVESLNVAIAVGVMLYEVQRQRDTILSPSGE